MNNRPTDEERRALLKGDRADVEPSEEEEIAMLADLLADPSTWVEPNAELEDAVVQAVEDAEPARGRHRYRVVLSVVAAAAVIAVLLVASFSVLATSSAPDYRVALGGTVLAPNAHGSVSIRHNNAGFHITLDANGLPTLPAGEYYQAWLKNVHGVLVPIGTFSSSDGRVTLWSGVSPKDFPTMTVTIERTDNVQRSSGRKVLTGVARPD
jgi:Anti-sigma-K factor rskA